VAALVIAVVAFTGITIWNRLEFAAAAEAMRRILVEGARRKRRLKRGGDRARQALEEAELLAPEPREDVLALDEALKGLAATDRATADLVQLRHRPPGARPSWSPAWWPC
jgi:hypothetical protein